MAFHSRSIAANRLKVDKRLSFLDEKEIRIADKVEYRSSDKLDSGGPASPSP